MAVMDTFEKVQAQNSMDHWWPRLQEVDVPTPETVRLEINETAEFQGGLALPLPDEQALKEAVRQVGGPPAFLRSDLTSTKHDMGKGSRIEDIETAQSYVPGIVENHHLSWGMPMPSSYYVREWLDLFHHYTAWAYDHHEYPTPIAAENRYFIYEGDVHGGAFYWPEDAITRPDREGWQRLHRDTERAAHIATKRIYPLLQEVCDEFDTGYWSVDFALTEDREWYCIDMARGEFSWHPEGIEQIRDRSDLVEDAEPRGVGE